MGRGNVRYRLIHGVHDLRVSCGHSGLVYGHATAGSPTGEPAVLLLNLPREPHGSADCCC